MGGCASVFLNRAYRSGQTVLERHRHAGSYIAVVLSGGYEEAGDRGCYRVQAGDVVLHGAFEAHIDRYNRDGAEVLDLALPFWTEPADATMRIPNPDEIVRAVEHDPREAVELVLSLMQPVERVVDDWPHQLAQAIVADPHLHLAAWAREQHLADATISRGFHKVFGLSPCSYRAQQRARRAARLAAATPEKLTGVALHSGFSDHAHMTRSVRALTGQTPSAWRQSLILVSTKEISRVK